MIVQGHIFKRNNVVCIQKETHGLMLQFMYSQGCVEVRPWDHTYKTLQKKNIARHSTQLQSNQRI